MQNVASVQAFYDADRRRDIEAWAALWEQDGKHTFRFATETKPVEGLAELVRVSQRKFDVRPVYQIEAQVDALEDPTLVLARLRLIVEGPKSPVELWCLFHFGPTGLIREIEEILDTAREPIFPT